MRDTGLFLITLVCAYLGSHDAFNLHGRFSSPLCSQKVPPTRAIRSGYDDADTGQAKGEPLAIYEIQSASIASIANLLRLISPLSLLFISGLAISGNADAFSLHDTSALLATSPLLPTADVADVAMGMFDNSATLASVCTAATAGDASYAVEISVVPLNSAASCINAANSHASVALSSIPDALYGNSGESSVCVANEAIYTLPTSPFNPLFTNADDMAHELSKNDQHLFASATTSMDSSVPKGRVSIATGTSPSSSSNSISNTNSNTPMMRSASAAAIPAAAVSAVITPATAAAIAPVKDAVYFAKYFLAGSLSGSFSHGVTVPFDVVKTRIQTDDSGRGKKSIVGMAKNILADEGPAAFLTGMGPTLSGYALQGSLKYGFYEVFKVAFQSIIDNNGIHIERVLLYMIAGACAETIGSTVLTPFEAARIRLVSQPQFASGIIECLKNIVEEEGLASLYNGLPPILLKQVPFTVVQLSSFEFFTSTVYGRLYDSGFSAEDSSHYQFIITAMCALLSGFLSTIVSQPGDTLLSEVNKGAAAATGIAKEGGGGGNVSAMEQLQQSASAVSSWAQKVGDSIISNSSTGINDSDDAAAATAATAATAAAPPIKRLSAYFDDRKIEKRKEIEANGKASSTLQTMIDTGKKLGLRGLYKGTNARILLVSVIAVTQLLMYDYIKQLCGIAATGAGGH